ncbi:MAG TPA: GatB/YqeY domain-containing protein [Candidatus Nanopelagicales bacterium]
MTDLKASLQQDLTEAIRGRDELTAATLRMCLAAITTEEVAGRTARTLSDDEVVGVLTKEAKKRREAATAFRDAGRAELAAREDAELAVLGRYLPEPLPEAEVAAMVSEAVAAAAASGTTGMPAMGRIMKELTPRTAGRFDGGQLAAMVRAALAG